MHSIGMHPPLLCATAPDAHQPPNNIAVHNEACERAKHGLAAAIPSNSHPSGLDTLWIYVLHAWQLGRNRTVSRLSGHSDDCVCVAMFLAALHYRCGEQAFVSLVTAWLWWQHVAKRLCSA
jgi:hypothetical protein